MSRRLRHFLALLPALLTLALAPAQAAQIGELPPPVRAALVKVRIPPDAAAIWVQPVDALQPTLSLNAGQPMNPASVMKLVTTFAALEQFGPARIWNTRLASVAPIRDGVLDGDLYLIGDGDPVLSYTRMWRLLHRLRGLGLHTINGDIVLDHSALILPPHNPDAFDGQGLRPYNTGPDGLLMNFNTLELGLFPAQRAQEPVQVVAEPTLYGIAIDNRILTSGGACNTWYHNLAAKLEGLRLVLSGTLPASCGPKTWGAAPLLPPDFGLALVRGLWQELGGTVRGKVRNGKVPANTTTLLSDTSTPLGEIVRDMNKWSNNVIARQLLANLGRTHPHPPPADMVAAGIQTTHRLLGTAGIKLDGFVIENGAGLSRRARIRADSLGTLLLVAWRRPWMPEFIASLPIVGRDGTTHKRLTDSPARGYAHLKTGTVNGVKAIAGYVLDRHGKRHVVVMLINHPEAQNARAAQDALIEWIWAGAGATVTPAPHPPAPASPTSPTTPTTPLQDEPQD
ncbi:D-alanyl-D-alanine carboxypeptidase [Betaproteobacteria bacterium]|nr:D-alanyl-D-alanine carboxypeptidase [Betaproteobacteria bacterium]